MTWLTSPRPLHTSHVVGWLPGALPSPEQVGQTTAVSTVTGTALDFCLVVTQRRHRTDTGLVITGQTAGQWMAIMRPRRRLATGAGSR